MNKAGAWVINTNLINQLQWSNLHKKELFLRINSSASPPKLKVIIFPSHNQIMTPTNSSKICSTTTCITKTTTTRPTTQTQAQHMSCNWARKKRIKIPSINAHSWKNSRKPKNKSLRIKSSVRLNSNSKKWTDSIMITYPIPETC